MDSRNSMAASATLHCLTGCAIGEIVGLMIGTAMGLSNAVTIALAIGLAFLFGYSLSTLPLIQAGLGFFAALSVVFAADTLSIAVPIIRPTISPIAQPVRQCRVALAAMLLRESMEVLPSDVACNVPHGGIY